MPHTMTVDGGHAADPGPAPRLAAATPWFAPPLQMLPLAARRCLVRNPLNGAAIEMSSGEYAFLSACEGCLPLAAHEARAASSSLSGRLPGAGTSPMGSARTLRRARAC